MAAPPTPLAPSTSAPSSSMSRETFEDIMAQFQCMDACLNTLSGEFRQVNTSVGRIAQCQAEMGGYTMPSTLVAPADESDANDADATVSDDDDDDDASSPSDDEMST